MLKIKYSKYSRDIKNATLLKLFQASWLLRISWQPYYQEILTAQLPEAKSVSEKLFYVLKMKAHIHTNHKQHLRKQAVVK